LRRWWFVAALIVVLIMVAAFYCDAAVSSWIAQHQTRSGVNLMRAVTKLGDWPAHVAIGLAGAAIAAALGRREWLVIFAAMVVACALAGSVNRAIKATAGRSRPSVKVDAGWNGPSVSSNYHSFPSGHTAASSAFFATLLFARRRIGLALLPIPLLIASSRVYLNAHYLSDVVFAAVLGTACALLVWRVFFVKYLGVVDTRKQAINRSAV
jgi:membrane-associated phospholipid phosphatase